ncbi:MAG TPA: hypothetical protein VFP87_08990 [Chitinophagaceae bacterium]|nr:hypothetical protein [Chitinophagaceae bacterium]
MSLLLYIGRVNRTSFKGFTFFILSIVGFLQCKDASNTKKNAESNFPPKFKLVPSEKFIFNNFVDCNMAEAWVRDTFRIFPGKYGEDTVWGAGRDLKFASGTNADEVFRTPASKFIEPRLPLNAPIGAEGLHGAVWFETIYQDTHDKSGKTLYAVYHNENYPENFPYDAATGKGYKKQNWPEGLRGLASPAAVCRIGIMKSGDGGWSWENKGIFLEDLQPRLILKPRNTSKTFAGGVGDPSAVPSGDYLYLFYGEYGYPEVYNEQDYNPDKEWSGQCISVARIDLKDLDRPEGRAKRWDGKGFTSSYDGAGAPITSLQIPKQEGGGPASSGTAGFYWGPSVSWNDYLNCWVMLMAKATGPSWTGSSVYISFNRNSDLGEGSNSQQWTKPQLLLTRSGVTLWYPSLQPMNNKEDVSTRRTCLRVGKKARLFVKSNAPDKSQYSSEWVVQFDK